MMKAGGSLTGDDNRAGVNAGGASRKKIRRRVRSRNAGLRCGWKILIGIFSPLSGVVSACVRLCGTGLDEASATGSACGPGVLRSLVLISGSNFTAVSEYSVKNLEN